MSPSTPSGNLVVGDTLTISYTKNAGGQSYVTIESLDSSIWNTSANTQLNDGESLVLTAVGTGTDQIIANFPSSNFQDHNRNVTVEAAVDPVIAPVVSDTVTDHIYASTTSSTTTVDIELDSTGSGGTLQYNVSTSTSVPTTGWTTSNPSVTRGTYYYLWARQDSSHYDRSTTSFYTPYLSPDTAITSISDINILSSSSSFAISIANGGANDVYQVRNRAGTEIHESRTGNGTITVTDAPAAGSSKDYSIYVKKPTASGGNNSYVDVGSEGDFTVTRDASVPSGGGTNGTTYNVYGSSSNITKNVFSDDAINLYYSVQSEDTNKSWIISPISGATANPSSGFFWSGYPTGSALVSNISGFSGSSYSLTYKVNNIAKFILSGTITDPYSVTSPSSDSDDFTTDTGNLGGTATSNLKTFNTARAGESLSYEITGGEVSIDGGTYTNQNGTITDGQTIRVRHTRSSSYSTTTTTTLTFKYGSTTKRTITFSSITRAQDVTPNNFDLGGPANFQNLNSYHYPAMTVTGIDSDASITVSVSGTGASYKINNGSYVTTAGTVGLNDVVTMRLQAASTYNTSRTGTLTVGSKSDTYTVRTDIYFNIGANQTVNPSEEVFTSFVVGSSAYGSSAITFTATNCQVSTDNSTWVSSVSRSNGQTVYVKTTASSSYNGTVTATVTGGGFSDSKVITTRSQDTTPDAFSLGSASGVNRGSTSPESNTIIISGMDTDASVTASITGSTGKEFRYKTSATDTTWSAWQSSNLTGVTNTYQFQVRVTASSSFSTNTTATLNVGGTSSTYTVTSEASVAPDTSVTFTTNTPLFTASNFTLTTAGTGSTTTYQVRTTNYTGTVIKTFTGAASNLSIPSQPSTSGTTYYVTAYVSDANDGTEAISNVGTFTVTRSSQVFPDSDITVSPLSDYTVTGDVFTINVSSANSNSVTDYRLVVSGTTTALDSYTSTGTSFSFEADSPSAGSSETYKIQARVPTGNNGDGIWEDVHSFTVTRATSAVVNGATTNYSHTTTNYAQYNKNVFNDDKLVLSWTPASADLNNSWTVNEITGASVVVENPASGFFHSGHYYSMVSEITFTSSADNQSYDIIYHIGSYNTSNRRVRFYGTISDPYKVTAVTFTGSSAQTPGTTNVTSGSNTFNTARAGETLDFSITNGELEKNGSGTWESTGTISDGDTYKLRGNASQTYGSTVTVSASFSKFSTNKGSSSYVILTEPLTAPTDLVFTNSNEASVTEIVTVTASGGTNGSLQIKQGSSGTWTDVDANNQVSFNHTRNSSLTYYTRRKGLFNQYSAEYSESHAVYATAPTDLSFTVSGNSSSTDSVTVTASGGYGGTLQIKQGASGTWTNVNASNQVSFDQDRGTSVTYYTRRNGTYGSGTYSESYSLGYLTPNLNVTIPATTFNVGSNTTTQAISITNVGSNETVRITSALGTWTASGKGDRTITVDTPAVGVSGTYQVEIKRGTETGGDNTTWYDTDESFTINRAANAAPVIGSFVASPENAVGTETVTLTANSVTDSDGTISSITIEQTGGNSVTLSTPTLTGIGTSNASSSVTFNSLNEAGSLTFSVTVTDDDGSTATSFTTVTTEVEGGGTPVTPPQEDGYGLEVYGSNGEFYLRISDKIVGLLGRISGTLTNSNPSDVHVIENVKTLIWDLDGRSDPRDMPRVAISGNTYTISRHPGSTSDITYAFILVGD
jgi:hypothetical protein